MSEHPNVERFRRLYEAFNDVPNKGSKEGVETIGDRLADDLVWHVPGRHALSGDRDKAFIMSGFEGALPGFSEKGERRVSTVDIHPEGIFATDEWVFVRVHWNHTHDGKRFDQQGVEVHRLHADGRIVHPAAVSLQGCLFPAPGGTRTALCHDERADAFGELP